MIDFDSAPLIGSYPVSLTQSSAEYLKFYADDNGMSIDEAVQTLFEIGVIYSETMALYGATKPAAQMGIDGVHDGRF